MHRVKSNRSLIVIFSLSDTGWCQNSAPSATVDPIYHVMVRWGEKSNPWWLDGDRLHNVESKWSNISIAFSLIVIFSLNDTGWSQNSVLSVKLDPPGNCTRLGKSREMWATCFGYGIWIYWTPCSPKKQTMKTVQWKKSRTTLRFWVIWDCFASEVVNILFIE